MKLKIGNKEYDANITLGLYQKLVKKYPDPEKAEPLTYSIDAIWMYIKRRWFGIKPFIFKYRLKNAISFKEFKDCDKVIAKGYELEDKEGGN